MKKQVLTVIAFLGLGTVMVQAQAPESPRQLRLHHQSIAQAQVFDGAEEITLEDGFHLEKDAVVEINGCDRIVFKEGFSMEEGAQLVATVSEECAKAAPAAEARSTEADLSSRPTLVPNPSSGPVSLVVSLDQPSMVSLRIYTIQGTQIAVPLAGNDLGPGFHEIPLELSGLAGGTYFYRATVNEKVFTGKIVRVD